MFLNKIKWMSGALLLSAAFLSSCGPVQFSSESGSSPTDTAVTPGDTVELGNPGSLRDVHYNQTVAATDNKVDIILVVDDSNSMLADNQKLANNLAGFVTKLQNSNIDWQMCATVTRALPVTSTQTAWGASIYWQSSDTPSTALGLVLKKGTANLSTVFAKTINYINAGWAGSDDERGIKAAYHHVYNGDYRYQPNSGCYRSDSAIAYIIISDEDERSIGGDAAQQVYSGELKALENEDKPDVFVSYVKETLGADRRFTVNSIIVKPGDTECKNSQDAAGTRSHYGVHYATLSNLTAGGIGSICDTDYSKNLNLFFDRIQSSLSSVPLECQPYNGNVAVTITPNAGQITSRVEGMSLLFSSPVPAGTTVDIKYQCVGGSRNPSSATQATPQAAASFWSRISSFFKGLF